MSLSDLHSPRKGYKDRTIIVFNSSGVPVTVTHGNMDTATLFQAKASEISNTLTKRQHKMRGFYLREYDPSLNITLDEIFKMNVFAYDKLTDCHKNE